MTLTSPLGENGLHFEALYDYKNNFSGTKTCIILHRLYRIRTSTKTPKGAVQVNQTLGDCRACKTYDSLSKACHFVFYL